MTSFVESGFALNNVNDVILIGKYRFSTPPSWNCIVCKREIHFRVVFDCLQPHEFLVASFLGVEKLNLVLRE